MFKFPMFNILYHYFTFTNYENISKKEFIEDSRIEPQTYGKG
jgi:hypothetical protein